MSGGAAPAAGRTADPRTGRRTTIAAAASALELRPSLLLDILIPSQLLAITYPQDESPT
jgi:hypothetical protein